MSVLNINELKQLAADCNLLGENYDLNNFQPSSYDLRIGAIFKDDQIYSNEFAKSDFTNTLDIKPSEIVLILTLERVTIPTNCIGTVFAINKQSSTGLLILNPGHIDPGYSGSLSICAINLSKEPKTLSIGEPIFTLIVQKLNSGLTAAEAYQNKKFLTRREEEQIFLKTRSKRLSNSFFDLISGYDGARKMLAEKLWERLLRNIGAYVKILAVMASFAGILKLGYDAFPDDMPVVKRNQEAKSCEKTTLILRSVEVVDPNVEIQRLKDSINVLNHKINH